MCSIIWFKTPLRRGFWYLLSKMGNFAIIRRKMHKYQRIHWRTETERRLVFDAPKNSPEQVVSSETADAAEVKLTDQPTARLHELEENAEEIRAAESAGQAESAEQAESQASSQEQSTEPSPEQVAAEIERQPAKNPLDQALQEAGIDPNTPGTIMEKIAMVLVKNISKFFETIIEKISSVSDAFRGFVANEGIRPQATPAPEATRSGREITAERAVILAKRAVQRRLPISTTEVTGTVISPESEGYQRSVESIRTSTSFEQNSQIKPENIHSLVEVTPEGAEKPVLVAVDAQGEIIGIAE